MAQTYGGGFYGCYWFRRQTYFNYGWCLGSTVVIDFDNNRIITVHSVERNYDYHKLIYVPLGYKVKPKKCGEKDSMGRVIKCPNTAK